MRSIVPYFFPIIVMISSGCEKQSPKTLGEGRCPKYEDYEDFSENYDEYVQHVNNWGGEGEVDAPCVTATLTVIAKLNDVVINDAPVLIGVQSPGWQQYWQDEPDDPYYNTDDIEDEIPIATGVTGEPISIQIAENETWHLAAWVGDQNTRSSDGFTMYEYGLRQYVHPAALVDVNGDSPTALTVGMNGYFHAECHCVMDLYEYDESQPDLKGNGPEYSYEGDHELEVMEGEHVTDVD